MARMYVTAMAEDLGMLSIDQKMSGDLPVSVYVSVNRENGDPILGLTINNFTLLPLDALAFDYKITGVEEATTDFGGPGTGFYLLNVRRHLGKDVGVAVRAVYMGLSLHATIGGHPYKGQTILQIGFERQ